MISLPILFSFVFGAIVGSFLNVVALRFNTGKTLGGRSKCMSCDKTLTWRELVPIFSFVAQKGACVKCKSKISWQYPLVEATAGIIFVLIILNFPPFSLESALTTLIFLISACLLLVISVYDIKHTIIPDGFVYTFDFLALANLFVGGYSWWHTPSLMALLSGPLIAFPFAFLWLVSRGRWMGLGDAKLALGIGWFLGFSGGINAIVLAFWIAAAASVTWLYVIRGGFKPRTEIPFGPYLILGMYLVLLFGVEVIDVGLVQTLLMPGV